MTDARLALALRMGVLPQYTDQTGIVRETGVETATALLSAMGLDAATEADARAAEPPAMPRDVICTADSVPSFRPKGSWHLVLEDGTEHEGRGKLPALPLGIHRLSDASGAVTLLAAPKRLPLPPRAWGVTAPLYGLSFRGIGSYDDLATHAEALGARGAAFIGINPVHAGFPPEAGIFSPYTPSHRRRLNILHLPAGEGSSTPLVDYATDAPAQRAALRAAYAHAPDDTGFDRWIDAEGASLRRFALHQALSERHGPFWNTWPTRDRDAETADATGLEDAIRFHQWAQWRAETALSTAQSRARAAGMRFGLYLDLAVGTHPHGAETWEDRASFATGASLGAPPDAFSAEGQTWGLAPFNPLTLRASAYAPLAETLRRQLRVSGLLRIDHILGFERAFWVPEGAPGAYMQMPRDSMLAVVRIEAARAGATVVGEDLGNIPEGLQDALAASGILGCRVTMFERSSWEPPVFKDAKEYDEAVLASFSTHDLPTWTGWREGRDIAERARIGDLTPDRARTEEAHRTEEVAAFDRVLPTPDLAGLHGFLAATPARLVALQAEILAGEGDQPNLPGTVTEYPNWQRRLPLSAEALSCKDTTIEAARLMAGAGRTGDDQ